ncbi:haloacid dehalogenase [Pseudoclavibacter endophyticus]|uniref:HAD family hydrolase n=1 Tax=Pseudoclavibacter endophyticus TaxID=1778590 RepID=A0A6H9WMJ3_9MICO|nr:Cof-type HAD-IIB family hydrolase [Pseudoclavibacter endophyticus]KAB1649021.1 HAD family hydrolase [Pseudoclavibacter endophyticus]GGA66161.1 haloacid dehalogenase [Pseudoclavibacter endophyticus]
MTRSEPAGTATSEHSAARVHLPSPEQTTDVRLVAVDMDGTLLDGDGELPDGLWEVLEALRARGIAFAPASGRQYAALRDHFDRVSDGMVFLAENGSYVVRDGRELASRTIEPGTAAEAVRLAREVGEAHADCGVVLCGKRSAYVERTDDRFLEAAMPYYLELARVPDLLAHDGPLAHDEIVKVAVFELHDAEPNVLPAMQRLGGAQVVLSSRHWVDIMVAGTNKGAALRQLRDELGITRDQTMAFGDFRNDLEMLAEARFSVAMAGAHPDVVRAASYLAPPNTDRGVLRALDASLGLGLGLA